jgi:hypothetical protein
MPSDSRPKGVNDELIFEEEKFEVCELQTTLTRTKRRIAI